MNNILDDDIYDDGRGKTEEQLAAGQYESNTESIMKGFRIFQKYYVYKSVAFQMLLVALGLASQIMAIVTAGEDSDVSTSYFLCAICVALGIYILLRPRSTRKRLEKSIKELKGTVYNAEIFTDKIRITTVYDPFIEDRSEEEKSVSSEAEEKPDEKNSENDEEENVIPATIVHLDNSAVELVDTKELYVLYV